MWVWILSAIASGLLGTATARWFVGTKFGIWLYDQYENFLAYINRKFGVDLLDKELYVFKKKYPEIYQRLVDFEKKIDKN